jgi:hypothetical protein
MNAQILNKYYKCKIILHVQIYQYVYRIICKCEISPIATILHCKIHSYLYYIVIIYLHL